MGEVHSLNQTSNKARSWVLFAFHKVVTAASLLRHISEEDKTIVVGQPGPVHVFDLEVDHGLEFPAERSVGELRDGVEGLGDV